MRRTPLDSDHFKVITLSYSRLTHTNTEVPPGAVRTGPSNHVRADQGVCTRQQPGHDPPDAATSPSRRLTMATARTLPCSA